MDNGIKRRQNEECVIKYLAAQRQLYDEAKKLSAVVTLLSVVLPFLLSVAAVLGNNRIEFKVAYACVSIATLFVSSFVEQCIGEKKQLAADIQQQADIYIYQMPWDEKFFWSKKDVTDAVVRKSKILLRKEGEKERLYNWYVSDLSKCGLEKGILLCQTENHVWDAGLRKRYRRTCWIVIVIMIAVIMGMGLWENDTLLMFLLKLAYIVPMLAWLLKVIRQLNNDLKKLEEEDRLIYSKKEKNMEDLQRIQKKIYRRRSTCFLIPSKFYNIFRENDEDAAHERVRLRLREELEGRDYENDM